MTCLVFLNSHNLPPEMFNLFLSLGISPLILSVVLPSLHQVLSSLARMSAPHQCMLLNVELCCRSSPPSTLNLQLVGSFSMWFSTTSQNWMKTLKRRDQTFGFDCRSVFNKYLSTIIIVIWTLGYILNLASPDFSTPVYSPNDWFSLTGVQACIRVKVRILPGG